MLLSVKCTRIFSDKSVLNRKDAWEMQLPLWEHPTYSIKVYYSHSCKHQHLIFHGNVYRILAF